MMRNRLRHTALLLAFIVFTTAGIARGTTLKAGMVLPSVKIEDKGEILLKQQKIGYQPWNSDSLRGKKVVLQYLPATLSSSKTNMPLINKLYELEYPDTCRTVNIVNIGDSLWGTEFIAEHEIRRHKKRTPLCHIIQDQNGNGKARWSLPDNTTTTMVINEAGVIEFIHSGRLSEKQIDLVVRLSNPDREASLTMP